MEEMESMQWEKVATENLKQGGSLQVERKSPVFLAGKVSHHNFCFILIYKKLWNISILTLGIYYVSPLCNAKVIKRTSFDLPNNMWGKYRVTEAQKGQVTLPESHSKWQSQDLNPDWLTAEAPTGSEREPEN